MMIFNAEFSRRHFNENIRILTYNEPFTVSRCRVFAGAICDNPPRGVEDFPATAALHIIHSCQHQQKQQCEEVDTSCRVRSPYRCGCRHCFFAGNVLKSLKIQIHKVSIAFLYICMKYYFIQIYNLHQKYAYGRRTNTNHLIIRK